MMTVEEMNAGFVRERDLWASYDEARLDKRIADRSGDDDKIAAAEVAVAKVKSDWHEQYKTNAAGVLEYLDSIGLQVAGVKRALG